MSPKLTIGNTAAAVLALAVIYASLTQHADASQYLGDVKTLPGTYPNATSITYDPNGHDFFALTHTTTAVSLYRVNPRGGSFFISSNFGNWDANIAYSPFTRLVYLSDPLSHAVVEVNPRSGVVTLLAGGTLGFNDGQGKAAQFEAPSGLAVDPSSGAIYVADMDRVRVITPGGYVSTLTPPGSIGHSNPYVFGLAWVSGQDVLLVADPSQQVIHQVTPSGVLTTLSGGCVQPFVGFSCQDAQRDGPYASALFGSALGITYAAQSGAIYVADTDNNQIRELAGGVVTTLSGNGRPKSIDGFGTTAALDMPQAIGYDPDNQRLYVFDQYAGLLRTVATVGEPPPPTHHGVILYDPPTADSAPSGAAMTMDGSLWFSESNAARIGRRQPSGQFAEYPLPAPAYDPGRMTVGADGNVWFTDLSGTYPNQAGAIGTITAAGAVSEYILPQTGHGFPPDNPAIDLTAGPDGNIWFTLSTGDLGYVTPTGAVTELPQAAGLFIATGYDRKLWTTAAGSVERYSTDGTLLSRWSGLSQSDVIKPGPSGLMWIAQPEAMDYVAHHSIISIPLPPCECGNHKVVDFTVGADHALYLAEAGIGYIGRLQQGGAYDHVIVPTPRTQPSFIVTAPDGTVWFVDPGSGKVGRWY